MAQNPAAIGDASRQVLVIGAAAIVVGGLLTTLLLTDITGALLAIAMILGVFYITATALHPKIGFYLFYAFTFWLFQLNRYVTTLPIGTIADMLLLVNVAVVMLRLRYDNRLNKELFRSPLVLIWAGWLVFTVLINLINVGNANFMSFLYGVRRLHLNPLGFTLLNLLVINSKKDFKQFLHVTMVFVFFSFLIAYRQRFFGFNDVENALLSGEFGTTHLLPTITRIWGPMAEAATYGIAMSIYSVVAIIYGLTAKNNLVKFFSFLVAAIALHQILLSGTRTAYGSFGIALVVIGLFYSKGAFRIYAMIASMGAYAFLRYTWIGENFILISRVRSAFNPNDQSFLVRVENRELLANWLTSNPLGGGIGATQFDIRFNPSSFLSTFPPDGMFVRFRAELGYAGEYAYYLVNILLAIYMIRKIMNSKPNGENRVWLIGGFAIFIAARVSEYAQLISLQFPLVNLLFLFLVVYDKVDTWEDREIFRTEKKVPFR